MLDMDFDDMIKSQYMFWADAAYCAVLLYFTVPVLVKLCIWIANA